MVTVRARVGVRRVRAGAWIGYGAEGLLTGGYGWAVIEGGWQRWLWAVREWAGGRISVFREHVDTL